MSSVYYYKTKGGSYTDSITTSTVYPNHYSYNTYTTNNVGTPDSSEYLPLTTICPCYINGVLIGKEQYLTSYQAYYSNREYYSGWAAFYPRAAEYPELDTDTYGVGNVTGSKSSVDGYTHSTSLAFYGLWKMEVDTEDQAVRGVASLSSDNLLNGSRQWGYSGYGYDISGFWEPKDANGVWLTASESDSYYNHTGGRYYSGEFIDVSGTYTPPNGVPFDFIGIGVITYSEDGDARFYLYNKYGDISGCQNDKYTTDGSKIGCEYTAYNDKLVEGEDYTVLISGDQLGTFNFGGNLQNVWDGFYFWLTDNFIESVEDPGVNTDELVLTIYRNISDSKVIGKTITNLFALSGTLRDACNVQSPVIRICLDDIEYIRVLLNGANYAYIPYFGRYYYIDSIEVVRDEVFDLHLRVDVLESFKDQILNASAKVLRSASYYNENLVDPEVIQYNREMITIIPVDENLGGVLAGVDAADYIEVTEGAQTAYDCFYLLTVLGYNS